MKNGNSKRKRRGRGGGGRLGCIHLPWQLHILCALVVGVYPHAISRSLVANKQNILANTVSLTLMWLMWGDGTPLCNNRVLFTLEIHVHWSKLGMCFNIGTVC